jgi:hypothetical protein
MSFTSCPIATVAAPVEQVRRLLADPAHYAQWWDAQTRSIIPAGPAHSGQRIFAQIQAVTPERHQLELVTRLPLDFTILNHINCTSVEMRSRLPTLTFISLGTHNAGH